jgi:hypothetical protein
MSKNNYFEFTIKPIPFAFLIYFIGWYDFKRHIFGQNITIGFFFMTVAVWIFISFLIRYRSKNKNNCNECKQKRFLAGFLLVFLPTYTLFYWIISINKI